MKRKTLVLLFVVLMTSFCAIGLVACDTGSHQHTMAHHEAKAATCTEEGNIEYWSCSGCGKNFLDEAGSSEVSNITIAAKGHSWGEWTITKPATCEEKGSQTHTCDVCDFEEVQTIPATGHTWGEWETITEASCKDGLRKHICEVCNKEEEEVIPATGEHKYKDTVIPPTADEPGYTLHKCEVCGEEYKDNYVEITFTEGLAYQLSNWRDYYILTGIGDATDTYLYLPATINNKPVKEIAANAFKDNTEITGVYISSGMEVIGANAFSGCTSLENITLVDSIKEIGKNAFSGTAYYENKDNWENNALYIGSCLIDVRETALGTLNIKEGTHLIASEAVYGCTNILDVVIPDTVKYINDSAFTNCTSLEEIRVPSTVETMGISVFYGCTSLNKLTIPFIGESISDTDSPFGYVFGMSKGQTNIEYVPASLKEVVILKCKTVPWNTDERNKAQER